MSRRIYKKKYSISGIEFSVLIKADVEVKKENNSFNYEGGTYVRIDIVIDTIDVVSIQIYNDDKGINDYQGVYPNDKLYQSIEEAFLSDESVGLEISEGS